MDAPAPFIATLFEIVGDPGSDGVIAWDEDGQSFTIKDLDEFTRTLLRRLCRGNLQSLTRQLNGYSFSKVRLVGAHAQRQMHIRHTAGLFVRDAPQLLPLIKRRSKGAAPAASPDGVVPPLPAAPPTTDNITVKPVPPPPLPPLPDGHPPAESVHSRMLADALSTMMRVLLEVSSTGDRRMVEHNVRQFVKQYGSEPGPPPLVGADHGLQSSLNALQVAMGGPRPRLHSDMADEGASSEEEGGGGAGAAEATTLHSGAAYDSFQLQSLLDGLPKPHSASSDGGVEVHAVMPVEVGTVGSVGSGSIPSMGSLPCFDGDLGDFMASLSPPSEDSNVNSLAHAMAALGMPPPGT